MRHRPVAALVLVATVAALSACADSSAPQPTDLGNVLADVAEVETYSSAGAAAGGAPMLPSSGTTPAACPFNAATQSFVCPGVTQGGMTMTRSFQLLDGSNTPQSAFDPATTAAVRTVLDMTGTAGSGTQFAADIVHHSDQSVGGLRTNTRTIDGTATTRYIRTSALGVDTLRSATNTDLTMPRPVTAGVRVYPTGTVATVMTSSMLPAAPITSTTTFNGTSTATMSMTLGGLTRSCTFNLEQPSQPPNCL